MNRFKFILRLVFFLLAVFLLVYINSKTNDHTQSIAEFKFKTIEKLRTDSLDSKHKLNLLLKETTKFVDDSSHVRNGLRYLTGLLGLWVATELGFLLLAKKNYGRQEIE